jgi:16S rRNA (guanine966-N2)-methyltransferase
VRITGGTVRGHKLLPPKSGCRSIRPTSDRTREALFSILGQRIAGSCVLDLYAGTGSLGIEALSRGAEPAVFVDQSRQALELIYANLSRCFSAPAASLFQLNLARPDGINRLKSKLPPELLFDLVFLDPPYEKKLAQKTLQMVEKAGIVRDGGLVIVEERKDEQLPEYHGRLELIDQRRYGETGLWLYRYKSTPFDKR